MKDFFTFLLALPDLWKLVQIVQRAIKDAKTEQDVSDGIKTIHEAFNEKNPEKLNKLFSASKQPVV